MFGPSVSTTATGTKTISSTNKIVYKVLITANTEPNLKIESNNEFRLPVANNGA